MFDFKTLYGKYGGELRSLAFRLRKKYHLMQRAGYRTVFGDVEGELLYMLIRETQPKLFFEISPAAGYSTNYILAALTANQSGELHSFELETEMEGTPIEQVIRGNLMDGLDQQRLHLHLGDARKLVPQVAGTIDFCLIDSCHEDWFAKWYTENVFPRVRGLALVQDVAFHDRLEATTEARFIWEWMERTSIPVTLIGKVEQELEQSGVRCELAERRYLQCNSLVFRLPQVGKLGLPAFDCSPDSLIQEAEHCLLRQDAPRADELMTRAMYLLVHSPQRANRHRLMFKMGQFYSRMSEPEQAERCFQRAFGFALAADLALRPKALRELWRQCKRQKLWGLAAQVFAIRTLDRLFHRQGWKIHR